MGLGQAVQKSVSEFVSPAGKGGYVLAIFKQSLVISFRITHHRLFFFFRGGVVVLDKMKMFYFSDRKETYVFNIGVIFHKDHPRHGFLNHNVA